MISLILCLYFALFAYVYVCFLGPFGGLMCLLSLCRSLSIEMLIGSYTRDDGVKRCRKGIYSHFPRPMPPIMHVHRRRCTRRSRSLLFRGPCRSRGKCLPSGPSSEPFQFAELGFSAAHARAYPAARQAVDRLLVLSLLQKTYKKKEKRK